MKRRYKIEQNGLRMETKQWESNNIISRASADHKRDFIKTAEIHTPTIRKSQHYQNDKQFSPTTSNSVASPMHREYHNFSTTLNQFPATTPSPYKTKPLQVRSASPRCLQLKEDKSYYSAANTPSLNSGLMSRYGNAAAAASAVPNYMAATESAKAKARSQSTPRQRPSTPERERGGGTSLAKKRLSYPAAPDQIHVCVNGFGCRSSFSQNLRSPSFKSAFEGHYGLENESLYSSDYYYKDSFGGEISPCSTTDLRGLKMRN